MSSAVVSLADFAEMKGEVNGVEIESRLPLPPYVPAEDIDVNLSRIARAARIGHLSGITIDAVHKDDQMQIGVAAANGGGEGVATALSSGILSKAARIYASLKDVEHPQFSRADSQMAVNFGHGDFDNANLRDPKLWARTMDKALRSGLRNTAYKKFTDQAFLRSTTTATFGLNILLGTQVYGTSAAIAAGIATLMQNSFFPVMLKAGFEEKKIERPRDIELSLFAATGLPLDRIALSSIYTHTHRFATVRKPKTK